MASGTAGAKASGGGSTGRLQNGGKVGVPGTQGRAGRTVCDWTPEVARARSCGALGATERHLEFTLKVK